MHLVISCRNPQLTGGISGFINYEDLWKVFIEIIHLQYLQKYSKSAKTNNLFIKVFKTHEVDKARRLSFIH